MTLGPGERAAIELAQAMQAELLLIDEWRGRQEAIRRAIPVMGTLGVLELGAERGLLDLAPTLARLQVTNFYAPPGMIDTMLARDAMRKTVTPAAADVVVVWSSASHSIIRLKATTLPPGKAAVLENR
jgi:hypothetical protein